MISSSGLRLAGRPSGWEALGVVSAQGPGPLAGFIATRLSGELDGAAVAIFCRDLVSPRFVLTGQAGLGRHDEKTVRGLVTEQPGPFGLAEVGSLWRLADGWRMLVLDGADPRDPGHAFGLLLVSADHLQDDQAAALTQLGRSLAEARQAELHGMRRDIERYQATLDERGRRLRLWRGVPVAVAEPSAVDSPRDRDAEPAPAGVDRLPGDWQAALVGATFAGQPRGGPAGASDITCGMTRATVK